MVFMESMEILVVMVSIVAMESMVFADNYGFYGKSGKCGNYKAPVWASGSPVICPERIHIWDFLINIWRDCINYLEYFHS